MYKNKLPFEELPIFHCIILQINPQGGTYHPIL
jgi:hypothetical protein